MTFLFIFGNPIHVPEISIFKVVDVPYFIFEKIAFCPECFILWIYCENLY